MKVAIHFNVQGNPCLVIATGFEDELSLGDMGIPVLQVQDDVDLELVREF